MSSGYQNDAGLSQQEAGFGFLDRFWMESAIDLLTAKAGGGRTGATKITSMFNRVSTAATAADSLVLPVALQGLSLAVLNDAANPVQVFGQGSDTINAVAGATGVPQMGKSLVWYTCHTGGAWIANGLGSGFSGANVTYSYADGQTALAGGGQAGATPVNVSTARFTTVATAGDSCMLMTAAPGLVVTIINAGAQILNVFPAVGDNINSLGSNLPFALPPGAVCDFFTTVAGTWHALGSVTGPQQAYNSASNTTAFGLSGAQISGGSVVVALDLTGSLGSGQALTLPTVAALVTALTAAGLNPQAGMSYELDIIARSAANAWTVTTNTGWTLTGTMTVQTQMRRFYVTLTSLTAAVLRSIGSFTIGAA